MRFNFHQRMGQLFAVGIRTTGPGVKTLYVCTFDHRRIIRIGDNGALWIQLMRVAYHAEQRHGLLLVVDHPVRIEYLVTAMLGICLCKHHQFNVCRIAL